ncbi:MAG: hypothetical protein KAI47_04215, partial [Deltaproteobacteria bacterium]|nr:hypothetical protein [Deltaproteobacteria bacterium]
MLRTGRLFLPVFVALVALPFACGGDELVTSGDELTSNSAVERELTIKGYVYVDKNASTYSVTSAVKRQVRSGFGPLRIAKISVDDRELASNVDPTTFKKQLLDVVKVADDGTKTAAGQVARVDYTYIARALVVNSQATKSSFSMALLMGNYQSFVNDIVHDCVENYAHDHEFASSFWYIFAPNVSKCKTRISKESTAVAKAHKGLDEGEISEGERSRRFLPVTVTLKKVAAPPTTYPEYDRLYGLGDPSKDRIRVYQIAGTAAHAGDPDSEIYANDMGFAEFFKEVKLLADNFTNLRVSTKSAADPTTIAFKGETIHASFADLYKWIVDQRGFPTTVASADHDAFRRTIHDMLVKKWLILEAPLTVGSGRETKRVVVEFHLLWGINSGWSVRDYFKEAFAKGDVVLYNGHSYIGSGPLDPSNYKNATFKPGYQIFFFNSCVSFNYYGVDYFSFKGAGSQDLDLVTNGIEVYIRDGGRSMGQFISALFSGKQDSWLTLMKKTAVTIWGWRTHDPNRVVDGELDNVYTPSKTPITVEASTWDPVEPPAPQGDLFFDDMEKDSGLWTATGMWHHASSGTCAGGAAASGQGAWYFGDDVTCTYDTSARVQGTLTSKTIKGITSTSKLSFAFYRAVERYDTESVDIARVEVAVDGKTSWKALKTWDSTSASKASWVTSKAFD